MPNVPNVNHPPRRLARTVLFAAAAAAIALSPAGAGADGSGAQPATAPPSGEAAAAQADHPRVVELLGAARTRAGEELSTGDSVAWGTEIVVAYGAILDIAGPDVASRIWGPAKVIVERNEYEAGWLELLTGRLIAAFRSGAQGAVATPSAVAGVRGTVVYAQDDRQLANYTCVCEGEVAINHRSSDASESVSATHHDRPLRVEGDRLVGAGMHNHTDEDVAHAKGLLPPGETP